MPFEPTVIRNLLAEWAETITDGSLHTGPPGRTGANLWNPIAFDQVRVRGNRIVATVGASSRVVEHNFTSPVIITHIAYTTIDGTVFAWRALGSITLGNRDSIVLPEQITLVTITERG